MPEDLSHFAEAAAETEMLNASSPAPIGPSDCYAIFPSQGRQPFIAKFVKALKPVPQRRDVMPGVRTEAARPQKTRSSSLAGALSSLPFVPGLF